MDDFKFSTRASLENYIEKQGDRDEKFGNSLHSISSLDTLDAYDANFVLFGIPSFSFEHNKFVYKPCKIESLLEKFLNIQINQFNSPDDLILLGEIDLKSHVHHLNKDDLFNEKKIKNFQNKLQDLILYITSQIKNAGKLPIMIGGQPNNMPGSANDIEKGIDKTSNVLIVSSTSDFYFSEEVPETASEDLSLSQFERCYAFGLHKNNIRQLHLEAIHNSKQMQVKFYEDLFHLTTLDKCVKFKNAMDFLNGDFSFQLNLNAIQNKSSASLSTFGFSNRDLRTFIKVLKTEEVNCFHLCGFEGLDLEHLKYELSYLVSDFIRKK